jgi:YVTN family beta-propeller protein
VARRGLFAVGVAVAGLLAFVPGAMARYAYVANSGDGTVSVIETASDVAIASIPVGGEPVDVAISPNGARAYVANKSEDSVAVIDTATNAVVGTVTVGKEPLGIAASPDGHRVYVTDFGDEGVSVIDTASNAVVGGPIPVGKEPDGVVVSPDGSRLFVAQRAGDVSIVDTSTGAVVDLVPDPRGPSRLALLPNGGRAFVTDGAAASVSAFNPANGNVLGLPIVTGAKPAGIAIVPGGSGYAASPLDGTLTPIDPALETLYEPIGGFPGATGIAIRPDGLQGYVTNGTGSTVSILDTSRNVAVGSIPVGAAPRGVAVVPDQGPQASFFISPARRRAKKALTFHASGSKDPDGKIVNYAWDFGDGGHVEGEQLTRTHRYRKPGNYLVTLAVTDEEGCSTTFVYTGQTASCNGSPAAVASSLISVGDTTGPILRLAGGKHQAVGGRVTVRARCPHEPCAVKAHGVLVTSFESNGEKRRRVQRLGGAQVLSLSRSWRKLRLRLPKRGQRAALEALFNGGEAKAKLSVVARDGDGELRLRQRKVKLTLP